MTDTTRELIQRMADELDRYRRLLRDDRRETHPLANEARAYLAQPEPEGPTDEELHDLWLELYGSDPDGPTSGDVEVIAHAAIARWGRPTVEPVPVSERLPGPEDCWPDGHEKVGCCWLWTPVVGLGRWEVQHCDWASEPGESYTHWLPYYAMPAPQP